VVIKLTRLRDGIKVRKIGLRVWVVCVNLNEEIEYQKQWGDAENGECRCPPHLMFEIKEGVKQEHVTAEKPNDNACHGLKDEEEDAHPDGQTNIYKSQPELFFLVPSAVQKNNVAQANHERIANVACEETNIPKVEIRICAMCEVLIRG